MSQLEFLAAVQRADGWFDARVDPATRPLDDRAPQFDGLGWALWAAGHLPADRDLSPIRDLLVRSAGTIIASLDPRTALPPVSPDYWEVPETRLTLGTTAPLLAGLQAAVHLLPRIGEDQLADSAAQSAERLGGAAHRLFGDAEYPRHLGGHQRDAAVAFLVPPYSLDPPRPQVLKALDAARRELRRPAGGLAPGAGWKRDGISWTPETALFALAHATSGQRQEAEALLHWLGPAR